MAENFRKESRKDFHRESGATTDDLRLGCMQRIADATEAMAKRHQELLADAERAKKDAAYWQEAHDRMARRVIAARGQITKLKRRAALPA